ncbi:MAG: hypothetical protein ABSB97_07340 [Thermoplasmata archaeon]|jgi:hypothetical protein
MEEEQARAATRSVEPPPVSRVGQLFRWAAPWQDWLFLPLVLAWLVINVGLFPAYPAFLVRVGTFETGASAIFPYTWTSSLLLFVYSLWLFRIRYGLDYVRTVVFALSLSFAATSLFEIIYQNIGSGLGIGNQQFEGQLINASAIALALSTVRFWRASKPLLFAVLLFVAGWILWVSAGYPQIFDPELPRAEQAYLFNATLKVGALVVLGLLVSFAGRRPDPSIPPTEETEKDRVVVGVTPE